VSLHRIVSTNRNFLRGFGIKILEFFLDKKMLAGEQEADQLLIVPCGFKRE